MWEWIMGRHVLFSRVQFHLKKKKIRAYPFY